MAATNAGRAPATEATETATQSPKEATEEFTPAERDELLERIKKSGEFYAARALGISRQTLVRGLSRPISRLTAEVVRHRMAAQLEAATAPPAKAKR
jgi:DNA invertase Pin-like site-specific DNA recombinase